MKADFILSKQDIDNLTEEETTVSEEKTYINFEIPEWVNWLARDRHGALYGYREKPVKCSDMWGVTGDTYDFEDIVVSYITDDPNHYPQVKWSDPAALRFKDGITWVDVEVEDMTDEEIEFINEDENTPEPDMIQNPPHYKQYSFEPIDIITEVVKEYPPEIGFHIGTTLKYLFRSPFKGNMPQDLAKSMYYLERANKELTDE